MSESVQIKTPEIDSTREVKELRILAWANALISGYEKYNECEWLDACGRRHIEGLRMALLDEWP